MNQTKGQKIKSQPRLKHRFVLSPAMILSGISSAFLLFLMSMFHISSSENLKAGTIEVTHVPEQVFVNDKSIDAPIINVQQITGPNTLLIQTIKINPDSLQVKNDRQ
jgi:hypothetical protein